MKNLTALIICSCFFLSCKQISKSFEETFKANDTIVSKTIQHQPTEVTTSTTTLTTSRTEIGNKDLLTDTNQLISAEKALRDLPQYAGKEIMIYSTVYFYNDGKMIYTALQNPQNPKYVDNYSYTNGVWSAPTPQQLSINTEIQSRMISLDKCSFKKVARVAKVFNEKASQIEGAKPLTNLYISIWDNKIHWLPTNIEGSRERYSIQFNADGTLETFRQD
jgi:hypothetical protein